MATTKKPIKHNTRWVESDEQYLILNYASGMSATCLAANLGRTVVAVYGKLATYGLVEFDKDKNAYYSVRALLYQFD